MFHRESTVHVDASPEAVFDYVTDVRRHPEWANEPMEIALDPGPERGKGAKFHSTVKFMGTVKATGEVIEETRPSRFVYECEDSSGHYRWTFTLTPEDGGTRLSHLSERLEAPIYVRVMQPILWPFVGAKMVGGGVANIKRNLESGAKA
ncbi:MAG TPA: SRPBCC family protein [Dehalococcoidia bacterium]|nr:SRPBCC family protein [Dehalococcoidia bacterium]